VYTRAEGFAVRDLVANLGKWNEHAYKGAVATPYIRSICSASRTMSFCRDWCILAAFGGAIMMNSWETMSKRCFTAFAMAVALALSAAAQAPITLEQRLLQPLAFRNLGPFWLGARVSDVAVPAAPEEAHL
jgi:hypothetical protein